MAARITRAKKKISVARIPYAIPRAAELGDRLAGVLAVVHLLFTAGHTAPSGPSLVRADLVEQALHLTRMLRELTPDSADARGLHALLLVTDARRATRTDAGGRLLRLSEQDRSRWDSTALAEADAVIVGCLRAGRPAVTCCRRRSRRCTPRRPRTTRPTGRRSSRSTTGCSRCGHRRSWR
jgi:RNA polymerase sigma-70 factor (ECF subfamily)